ncbi:MAG: serine/threonine-protein kinase [Pirellulales bacterium]
MNNAYRPTRLGSFRITAQLGRGGMGMVYEGIDDGTGQTVALKVLNPGLADDESFRERFQAEIETLRKLKHPHIVELYGFGEDHGHLYYVMERVWGRNLQEELSAGRRFDWREVTRIGIQVCAALKHAHDHGIIHRDLKPANLLWTDDEQVKLTDFGIARLFGMARITQGSVLGTADYMAPEQAAGLPVTARCDLYSLGCVIYALLTGRPPFTGKSVVEVIHKVQRDAPVPPEKLVDDLPAEMNRIVLQLLEKDPQKRLPTALAVSNRLQAMIKSLTVSPLTDVGTERISDVPTGAPDRAAMDPERRRAIMEQPTVALELDSRGRPMNPELDDSGITLRGPVTPADLGTALPASEVGTSDRRYTSVRGAATDGHAGRETREHHQSWWVAAILVGLAALLVAAWAYNLRPLSADRMYERISGVTEAAAPRNWTDVDGLMAEFLERYPEDERADQIKEWQQELVIDRYARRLEQQERRGGGLSGLHPYEQLYLEAVALADDQPNLAASRLESLINLGVAELKATSSNAKAPSATDTAQPSAQPKTKSGTELDDHETVAACLEVAKRRLEQLQKEQQRLTDQHKKFIEERLETARTIAAKHPALARDIANEIVQLYGDREWASELVAQARELAKEP